MAATPSSIYIFWKKDAIKWMSLYKTRKNNAHD
jgi:hypothetical protein